jgi:hypothetical protein
MCVSQAATANPPIIRQHHHSLADSCRYEMSGSWLSESMAGAAREKDHHEMGHPSTSMNCERQLLLIPIPFRDETGPLGHDYRMPVMLLAHPM